MESNEVSAAKKLLESGKLDDAKAMLDVALKDDPKSSIARGLMATTLLKMGKLDESIALYEQLVYDNPADPPLRLNLGSAFLMAKRFEEAVDQLLIVLDFEPDHKKALGFLGAAYANLGRYEEAQSLFIRCGNTKMAEKMEKSIRENAASSSSKPAKAAPPSVEPTPVAKALPDEPLASVAGVPAAEPVTPDQTSRTEVRNGQKEPGEEDFAEDPFAGKGDDKDSAYEPEQGERFQQVEDSVTRFNSAEFIGGADGSDGGASQTAPSTKKRHKSLVPADGANLPYKIGRPVEIEISKKMHTRISGLMISTGNLTFTPLELSSAGSFNVEGNGRDQMLTILGDGTLSIAPEGRVFVAIQLRNELAYFQDRWIYSFEPSLQHEVSCIPFGKKPLSFMYLQGTGSLLLALPGPLLSKSVSNDVCQLPKERIVGWKGRLLPQLPTFPENCQQIVEDLDLVEMRGTGTILFTLDSLDK